MEIHWNLYFVFVAYENGKRSADTSTLSWWQIYACTIEQYKMRFHFITERRTTTNKFRNYFNLNCYHYWIEWILWLLCLQFECMRVCVCVCYAHRLPTNTDFLTIHSHSYDKLIERKTFLCNVETHLPRYHTNCRYVIYVSECVWYFIANIVADPNMHTVQPIHRHHFKLELYMHKSR